MLATATLPILPLAAVEEKVEPMPQLLFVLRQER
jgi:hypothetical protein